MRKTNEGRIRVTWICNILLTACPVFLMSQTKQDGPSPVRSVQVTLPHQEHNRIKTSWPTLACWFWMDQEFKPDGYKLFIDEYEKHSAVGLITASLRHPGELTDPAVHDRIKAASEYAHKKGMGIVMDLDVRLAREAFKQRYPDELQQILLLREFPLKDTGTSGLLVKSPSFGDHYTYKRDPYSALQSKLLRVYSYEKENGLIKAGTLTDITIHSEAKENQDLLAISVDNKAGGRERMACALVAVTVYTPDIFAPHLLSYQREIFKQYADASLAGAAKDEWGFPGRVRPPINELWYSSFMANEYQKRRPGHDLLRDMLLMSYGEKGKETERSVAVNYYMEMNFKRNAEIETDFYNGLKEALGDSAMSATHPTWYPYPDSSEVFKNGLSWWSSTRDLAQTDEATPYSARTALAKKWQSPLWYNMFYTTSLDTYPKDMWIAVLGGGRLNFHPLFPFPSESESIHSSLALLQGNLMRAESRIKLLNYISASPVDCRVAVVFGHPSALNWANKKGFADAGVNITDRLWKEGYYADLIPSSEIVNGSLTIGADGKICYGPQHYDAVLYYDPESDHAAVASFFKKAAGKNKTALFRIGGQTMDFEGKTVNANNYLPASMRVADADKSVNNIITLLKAKGVRLQTPCVMRGTGHFAKSMMPVPSGSIRLIDGTVIFASGEKEVMGDPIQTTLEINGRRVNIDAVGVAGIKLRQSGEPEALAFGGLKSFSVGTFRIDLPERMDIALLWENGAWRGIVHGYEGAMPDALTRITKNWTRVRVPVPGEALNKIADN